MKSWDISELELQPHSPQILSTTDEARAIALEIPAGEALQDHQVHERAWVIVVEGEVEITTPGGESVLGGSGLMVEFAPAERHAVLARTASRIVLLLTPWPGDGHPGTMTLEDKARVRQHARESSSSAQASSSAQTGS